MLNFNDVKMGAATQDPNPAKIRFGGGGHSAGMIGMGAMPEGGPEGQDRLETYTESMPLPVPEAQPRFQPGPKTRGPLQTLAKDPEFADSLNIGMSNLPKDHIPVVQNFLQNIMSSYDESAMAAQEKQQLDSQVRGRFQQSMEAGAQQGMPGQGGPGGLPQGQSAGQENLPMLQGKRATPNNSQASFSRFNQSAANQAPPPKMYNPFGTMQQGNLSNPIYAPFGGDNSTEYNG